MKRFGGNLWAVSGVLAVLVVALAVAVSLLVCLSALGYYPEGGIYGPAGWERWNRTIGGTDYDVAYSLIEASDGGYVLAGYTESFGAGWRDFWLVKFTAHGNVEWNRTYGGISGEAAYSLVETPDGGYAMAGEAESFGAGSRDFWLVKTDAYGCMEWNKTYGGPEIDRALSLVVTSDGGYAIAGYTGSFGAGSGDFWLIKTDAAGNMLWNQTYGGARGDHVNMAIEAPDGGYAIAGETLSFGAGNYDSWLVKTDKYGEMEWNLTYGSAEYDERGRSVVATSDGGYTLAGYTDTHGAGAENFWLIKIDESGNIEWSQTYDSTGDDTVESLLVTSDGGYAMAGYTSYFDSEEKKKDPNNLDFQPHTYEMFLIKTDVDGNVQWNQTYGKTDWPRAYSLVATSDGGYALAGRTASRSGTYPDYVWNIDFCLVKTG